MRRPTHGRLIVEIATNDKGAGESSSMTACELIAQVLLPGGPALEFVILPASVLDEIARTTTGQDEIHVCEADYPAVLFPPAAVTLRPPRGGQLDGHVYEVITLAASSGTATYRFVRRPGVVSEQVAPLSDYRRARAGHATESSTASASPTARDRSSIDRGRDQRPDAHPTPASPPTDASSRVVGRGRTRTVG